MHELSLCGAIYDIADRAAAGRPVSVIHLQVGRMRQIVPDTLAYCWTMVCDDTPLAGSRLDVDYRPVTLRCLLCGTHRCHRATGRIISPINRRTTTRRALEPGPSSASPW